MFVAWFVGALWISDGSTGSETTRSEHTNTQEPRPDARNVYRSQDVGNRSMEKVYPTPNIKSIMSIVGEEKRMVYAA